MKKISVLPLLILISFALLAFSISACKKSETQEQSSATAPAPATSHDSSDTQAAPASSNTNNPSAAGIQWTVPSGWKPQGERPMRLATYSIPPATGDPEGGECAVFFFGAGQGGNVSANIDRWVGQFENASKPEQATRTVNGIPITTVTLTGTYTAAGGPMMQSQGKKENYRLLGAIAEAPEGAVFFKTTGPAATIQAAEKDFNSLLESIRKS